MTLKLDNIKNQLLQWNSEFSDSVGIKLSNYNIIETIKNFLKKSDICLDGSKYKIKQTFSPNENQVFVLISRQN